MIRTSNKNSSIYSSSLDDFKGSNIFGENTENLYIVYSYGYHFPMFVYDKKEHLWFENSDKYSVSTSKQQNQVRPYRHPAYTNERLVELSTNELKSIIEKQY